MMTQMIVFFTIVALVGLYLIWTYRRKPSANFRSVDQVVPAFNEELLIERTIRNALANPFINKVIVVNDGSTDRTQEVLDLLTERLPLPDRHRLVVIHQANTGKGGALMNGIRRSTSEYVFLTDADTTVKPDGRLGYMLAELEAGADAVGGIATPNLQNATLPPHIRASVKIPMTILKRTLQQMLGGAAFIVSGSCGMFRRQVLLDHPFSDRTKVEDLDLTWNLIRAKKKIRLASRCVVYPQSCRTIREDWIRYRRWIVGYAVCMRLHKDLLLTRYGLFSILPMFLLACLGAFSYVANWTALAMDEGIQQLPLTLFPLIWVGVTLVLGTITAIHYRKPRLVFFAPFAVFYIFLAYSVWLVHGIPGLFRGKEPERDKPTRYSTGEAHGLS